MLMPVQNSLTLKRLRGLLNWVVACFLASSTVMAHDGQARRDTLLAVSPDVTLHVIEAGPPEAQTIVLIPGWCFTAEIWNKQITALSDRYHIIAVDPRSQGRSTILDHANSPDDRAGDIAHLIAKLRLRKPVLVGWSQGVQDVAAYALAYGTADVSGLVLVDAPVSAGAVGLEKEETSGTLGLMPLYVRSPRDYFEGMVQYIFKRPLTTEETNAIVSAGLRTPTSVGVSNLILDFYGKDYRPSLKRIEVPALVVVAGTAQDKEGQIAQGIPNSTTAVVEGAGHAVFYDEPSKFNEILVQFLERHLHAR